MDANNTPTVFPDDKLQKLKNDLGKHIVIDLTQDDGLRLLERLEAAEECVKVMQECSECNSWGPSIDAIKEWKKASGKPTN